MNGADVVLFAVGLGVAFWVGHGAGVHSAYTRLRWHARRATPRDLSTLERLIDSDDHRRKS